MQAQERSGKYPRHMIRRPIWLAIFVCLFGGFVITMQSARAIGERPNNDSEQQTIIQLAQAMIPPADRADIARRLLGVSETSLSTPPTSWRIGDRQSFNIVNSGTQLLQVETELLAISDHTYIWADVGSGISPAEAQQFAQRFDDEVYAPLRAIWGSEPTPGIDGDARLYLVFSDQVGASTGAYFTSQNLYSATIVPNSNEHEMLVINRNLVGASLADDTILSVASHEFQHMIRYNQRPNTATWLDEGYSMFTEQYLGWQGNQWAINAFMARPSTQLNTWRIGSERSAHYGGSMLFVGYLYERCGLDGLRAISQTAGNGMAIVDRVVQDCTGADVIPFVEDWALANHLHNRSISAVYGYRSDIWASSSIPSPQAYESLSAVRADFNLQAEQWSAQYIPLNSVQAGDTLQVEITHAPTVPLIGTQAYNGRWMWYSHNADQSNPRLTRAFDLRNITDATLSYQIWYDLEEGWDYAYVTISADGGQTWQQQTTPLMSSTDPFGRAYGIGYTGASDGWVEERFDLSAFVGQEILFRIEMITDDAVTHEGIAIDDIRLEALGYADDVEATTGNWQSEGWVRIDNSLPQTVSVLLLEESAEDIQITRWHSTGASVWQHTIADHTLSTTLIIIPTTDFTTRAADIALSVERR